MGSKKMYRPKYSMFFDLHAMQECHDVWHAFDAEKEKMLKEAGRKQMVLYAPTFSPSLTSLPVIKEALVELVEKRDVMVVL